MAGAGRARASVLLAREEDDREPGGDGLGRWSWAGWWALGKSRWVLSLFLSLFYFLQLVLI